MNSIEKMINELCPEGVKRVKLGEVCEIERGKVFSKKYISENKGMYPVYSSQTANEGVFGLIDTFEYDGEYLTWTTDGAYAGTVFYRKGRFSITNVCGLIKVSFQALHIKFLYYWLSLTAKSYVYEGMGNPKLMSNQVLQIEIPLPPLPIQEEIVRILDKCTDLIKNLDEEIALRQKQYEFYRNQLLGEELDGVERVKLGKICQKDFERLDYSDLDEFNYVGVENLLKDKKGRIDSSSVPDKGRYIKFIPKDILIGNIRPYLKKIWLSDREGGTNGDVIVLRLDRKHQNLIVPKYFFYIMSSDSFFNFYSSHIKVTMFAATSAKDILKTDEDNSS